MNGNRVQLKSFCVKPSRLMRTHNITHYSIWINTLRDCNISVVTPEESCEDGHYTTQQCNHNFFSQRMSLYRSVMLSKAGKVNALIFDTKHLLPDICLGVRQTEILKISLYTEKPMLCLEQITETSPLKLRVSKRTPAAYYRNSNCQNTVNCKSFRRQSICSRNPK